MRAAAAGPCRPWGTQRAGECGGHTGTPAGHQTPSYTSKCALGRATGWRQRSGVIDGALRISVSGEREACAAAYGRGVFGGHGSHAPIA